MAGSTYKIVELVGTSDQSWEDAAKRAVETAGESLKDLRIAEITKLDMTIEDGKVAMFWLILAYFIHTSGELCLSPVGMSAVTKLSISRVVSVSMGTWFLAMALSETVASRLGKMAAIKASESTANGSTNALVHYTELFEFLMWAGIIVGIVVLVLTPLLKKGMHNIH